MDQLTKDLMIYFNKHKKILCEEIYAELVSQNRLRTLTLEPKEKREEFLLRLGDFINSIFNNGNNQMENDIRVNSAKYLDFLYPDNQSSFGIMNLYIDLPVNYNDITKKLKTFFIDNIVTIYKNELKKYICNDCYEYFISLEGDINLKRRIRRFK